ncbi:MAG: polyprenyl synthetase family protein, partial [Chloroflexi bacterium]|nr:polyprenyl synthetase family protein [Chloroflexota bacterium]
MTGRSAQQVSPTSPYEEVYGPIRSELQAVVLNIVTLAQEQGSHEGAMADRLEHVLSAPGKRLRPAITLLASRLWGGPSDLAVMMGTAVELLHIATLIHDDTIDDADTRRGRETASNLWGRNVAVLLGDYVFAAAARFVCDTNSVRLVRRFSETIMELSRGELNELLDGQDPKVTRAAYFQRIYDKTASLFSTAAESGAVLGGAPESKVQLVKNYGYKLGMAYQVLDDVLDYESTSEELGKPAGNDLKEGVLTLPAIMLIEAQPESNAVLDLFKSARAARKNGQSGADENARATAIDSVRTS